MKVCVVFDWVREKPIAVYTTEEKAGALCDRRFTEYDEPAGNTTYSWEYDCFELDADPEKVND